MRVRALVVLCTLALMVVACRSRRAAEPERGNVARGRELVLLHECHSCHVIPGIDPKPGPGVRVSLAGFAERPRFAHGTLDNTRANLERYIQKPRTLYPSATMPGIGDRPSEAVDIAAFIMTLD